MKATLLLSLFSLIGVAANASVITFNFDSSTGNLGHTQTYTVDGFTITATAEPNSRYGPDLYGKAAGGDENGIGLTNDWSGDHEITPGSFIQLSITSITPYDPLTLIIDSSTGDDAWAIYQTNSANTLSGATLLKSGTSEHSFTVNPTGSYLDITATSGNVLLNSLSFDPNAATPEPASMGLIGGGLGLLGLLRFRRKS